MITSMKGSLGVRAARTSGITVSGWLGARRLDLGLVADHAVVVKVFGDV
jgi:hypothetical protein